LACASPATPPTATPLSPLPLHDALPIFACGLYPAEEWFVASVRAEAAAQIDRLAHHACLALWCGNNEDYSIAASLAAFPPAQRADRKSTRLNSSHGSISYAVFGLEHNFR